jgi:hypothetical protein
VSDLRLLVRRAALALLLAVAAAGCGDDDESPTGPTSAASVDVSGSIANNHTPGHVAVVTAAQVAAGRAVTLDIRGAADHSHILELTNDDVVRLQQRQRVERDASMQNTHTHRVTFF